MKLVNRTNLFAAVVALSFLTCATSDAQTRHRVTFNDLQTIKELAELNLSPDGRWLAYVSEQGELSVTPILEGSPSRSFGGGTDPIWAPDSTHLAYYATDNGETQLHVLDLTTFRSEQVTHLRGGVNPDRATEFIGTAGHYHDALKYSWSPDSTELVFSSQVVVSDVHSGADTPIDTTRLSEGLPLILTTSTPPEWTSMGVFAHGGDTRRFTGGKWVIPSGETPTRSFNQLFITDIRTKRTRQLTADNDVYFTPDWSPDGRHIVCVSMEGRPLSGWGSGPTNLYLINAATGQKRALTFDNLYKRIPQISPNGQWIAFHSQETPGDSSLSIVAIDGGRAKNLTRALDRQPFEFRWVSDSKSLLFTFQDGRTTPLATLDILTQRVTPLPGTEEPAYRSEITVSRTGLFAWLHSGGTSPPVIYVLAPDSIIPHIFLNPNPQIAEWELGQQEIVHWKSGRGEDLDGILIKPADYQKGRKYPLLVDCYPGTVGGFHGWAMSGNQAWASKGYAVFWPASRAPHVWINPYKSRQFDEAAKGPSGIDILFDDVISGIDELIRQGVVDEHRIGLYGFSNGGAVATQLLSKTSRFKCAVVVAPAASVDWTSKFLLHTQDSVIAYTAGALPWEDPNRYVQLSVAYRMDKVTTPTLLADGDDDVEFLLSTIELYNGLRWLHRDVTLLRYPHQGHGFEGQALKDFFTRTLEFFDRYLSPTNISGTPACQRK